MVLPSESVSQLDLLPYPLILHIATYLEPVDIYYLGSVNKILRIISMEPTLWQRFAQRFFRQEIVLPLPRFQFISMIKTSNKIALSIFHELPTDKNIFKQHALINHYHVIIDSETANERIQLYHLCGIANIKA